MQRLAFAVIAAVACGQTFTLSAVEKDARILHAIAAVESGNDHKAVGDGGSSLGAWQMQAAAWAEANADRRLAGKPEHRRSAWADPFVQHEMAASFLRVIRRRFAAVGKPDPTPSRSPSSGTEAGPPPSARASGRPTTPAASAPFTACKEVDTLNNLSPCL